MNSTNSTYPTETYDYQKRELNYYYAICEVLVAVFAVVGNALVIFVFHKERRLRRRTNYYIVSLAAADFLVGLLGIPFAILSSIGLPTNLHLCLFTASLLVVLCTISIFCLVAVSVDRYWAILHPLGYSRNVRTRTALVIISICWVAGSFVGFLPLMGWHKDAPSDGRCFFLDVMDYNYLVFLYFGTIITPAILIAAFYTHIYQVVLKQLRRIVTMNPKSTTSGGPSSGGTMLRMLGAAQKREVKATQNLSIIVLFFMICWIPLYTINCILAFCRDCHVNSTFMLFCIILSHLNSAGNPLLYAYHLRDFRSALKNFFCNIFLYKDNYNFSVVSNNNYNNYRVRNASLDYEMNYRIGSQIYYRKRPLQPSNQISTIVRNSTALAAATAGDTAPHTIWNVPEVSSDSADSLKDIGSSHHDRISMIQRPPSTPYRPRMSSQEPSSQVNEGYVETSSNDSDDVFIRSPSSCVKYARSTSAPAKCASSPQLNRNVFLIEEAHQRAKLVQRSSSFIEHNSCAPKVRPLRAALGESFNQRQRLGRSLSNDATTSDESLTIKTGAILRSSCGS